jgi:excinuclease ABC subunit B
MEGAYSGSAAKEKGKKEMIVAEDVAAYLSMNPHKLAKELQKLERKMYQHASKLEFEEAAAVRDQIAAIKAKFLIS